MNHFLISFNKYVQNDAAELEGMNIWESQFINNGLQEHQSCFITKCFDNGLAGLTCFSLLISLVLYSHILITLPICNEKYYSSNNINIESLSTIIFLSVLHLAANFKDKGLIFSPLIVFKVIPQTHNRQIIIIIAVDFWNSLDFLKQINLEILAERIRLLNVLRISSQNDISELNALLWQVVHEVEVELT